MEMSKKYRDLELYWVLELGTLEMRRRVVPLKNGDIGNWNKSKYEYLLIADNSTWTSFGFQLKFKLSTLQSQRNIYKEEKYEKYFI